MEMSKYCKAYPIARLREYPRWREHAPSLTNAEEPPAENGATDTDAVDEEIYLFVHDNYTVTNGIAKDENIVFDEVTPEWQRYCADVLEFEIPEF